MIDSLVARLNAVFPDTDQHPPMAQWPLSLARMAMGALWLASLRWKLPPEFDAGDNTGLRDFLELEVEHAAFGFYGDIIDSIVLPNFTLFAWLVFLTELVVGIALLVGFKTRIAALVGLGMSFNLLIGLLEVPGEWIWSYLMMIMWHGTILVTAPKLWSVDGRRSPLTNPATVRNP